MNFYKHHLGDYDGATAHLSWEEDMAYTRLLRAYYRRERSIPQEEAHRLVRATSKAQREAVDAVLGEFFERREDGWHNKRADEEITAYQSQATTNRRIARERTVQRSVHESSTKGPPNQEPRTINQKAVEVVSSSISGDQQPKGRLGETSESATAHQRFQLAPGWWNSDEGIREAGRKVGMDPRPGEGFPEYKNRIFSHIRGEKAA